MGIPRTSSDNVKFWDGEEYSSDELDAYLPGLADYASAHPILAERVPFEIRQEVMGLVRWTALGIAVFGVCVAVGFFDFGGVEDTVLASAIVVAVLAIGFGSRFLWSASEARTLPIIRAHGGHIEVLCWNPSWEMEDLVWSAPIAEVEWRLGATWKATRPAFRFSRYYRRIVLLKGPPLSWTNVRKRGFRKEYEYYGCGWTAETQAMWLALFRIVEAHG